MFIRTAENIEIARAYHRLSAPLASYWPFFDAWSANSQYGYELSWHKTRSAARKSALAYYQTRMRLIRQ